MVWGQTAMNRELSIPDAPWWIWIPFVVGPTLLIVLVLCRIYGRGIMDAKRPSPQVLCPLCAMDPNNRKGFACLIYGTPDREIRQCEQCKGQFFMRFTPTVHEERSGE